MSEHQAAIDATHAFTQRLDAIGNEFNVSVEAITQTYLTQIDEQLDIAAPAEKLLTWPNGKDSLPAIFVEKPTVDMLIAMTDGVIDRDEAFGETILPTDVVEFKVKLPAELKVPYGLTIYSIPSDVGGFNTLTADVGDNSRRWTVYIDRGTNFGSAFDNKGTVYKHLGFDPSHYRQNIDTGSIGDLISTFYADGAVVEYSKIPERGAETETHFASGDALRAGDPVLTNHAQKQALNGKKLKNAVGHRMYTGFGVGGMLVGGATVSSLEHGVPYDPKIAPMVVGGYCVLLATAVVGSRTD